MATNYNVNYNDKRFTKVNNEKNVALKESDKTYNKMINSSDKYYDKQIDAAEKWGDTQSKLQQEQTDFAIEKIEQQKEQAHKDYIKEQSGAYVDWQKQSNDYGTNAEKMADSGLAHTGYSESSQVSMYNTYQNRVATARETFNRAILNYDNAIKDARLQNNAKLAEIAYQTLQTTLELALQGFQYKNTLILDKANKKLEIDNMYYNRYQDVLKQINTENALAEEVRQYNERMAEEKRQYNQSLALQKAQLEEEKRQHNASMALQREQFAWQKAQASKSSGGSGGVLGGAGLVASGVKKSSSGAKKSSSGKSTLDMNSVINLGYGPINADSVAELVAMGKVKMTEKNGVITVKNVNGKPTKKEVQAFVNRKSNASKYFK